MKKVALAAAMALALGGSAQAAMFDYAKFVGGVTFDPALGISPSAIDPMDMETGYNIGGTLGWNLTPNFSFEGDVLFTASDFHVGPYFDASLKSFSFMANIIYSFDIGWDCRPFVGLGAGGVQVTISDGSSFGSSFTGDSDMVFGYQAMAGFTVPIDSDIDFLLEYRYQAAEDSTITLHYDPPPAGVVTQEYQSHNISAGFRFNL